MTYFTDSHGNGRAFMRLVLGVVSDVGDEIVFYSDGVLLFTILILDDDGSRG